MPLKVGVVALVMPSLDEGPLSLEGASDGFEGEDGGVRSIVTARPSLAMLALPLRLLLIDIFMLHPLAYFFWLVLASILFLKIKNP